MRVKTAAWILILLWPLCMAAPAALADYDYMPLLSETAILMDAASGQILFDKDMHRPMAPASITKIMTAILALEYGDLNDRLTVSPTAAVSLIPGAANIALKEGETLSLRDLLYALMLPSANDAALVIAEYVAGTQDAFIAQMNERAASLGALNTSFMNPHGLTQDGHLTTAYDMALILQAAISNPVFVEIASAQTYTIDATNLTPEPRPLRHTHAMVLPRANADFPFDGILCGKTGFTTPSGHTLATAARRDGRTLITVVIKSTGTTDKYLDSVMLLEYGFSAFVDTRLPLSELTPFTLTDADGSVWTVSPERGEDASFLLHHSAVDAAVEARYTGDADGGEISLVLPDAGNGALLYPVLWHGEASLTPGAYAPPAAAQDTADRAMPAMNVAEPEGIAQPELWMVAIFVFLLASAMAACTLMAADRSGRKRRRRR